MVFAIALSGTVAWSQVSPHSTYGPIPATDAVLQQMLAARAELRDAENALTTLTQKIRKRLETQDPVWVNRSQAAHSAEIERDRVRDAVLAALMAKPAYMEAQDAEAM